MVPDGTIPRASMRLNELIWQGVPTKATRLRRCRATSSNSTMDGEKVE